MKTKNDTNYMLAQNANSQKALANLSRAIDVNLRFPKNVFQGIWSGFFFFDADWIFEAQFVERTRELLEIEGGQCACMIDLDAALGAERTSFFINKEITGPTYQAFLNGPSVGDGWLHGVGRFGCTSEVSEWCIYCEKGNEVAVIAVRDDCNVGKYRAAIAQLKSLPIGQAMAKPLSYGFSARALSAEWQSEFIKEYGALGAEEVDMK